MLNTGMKKNFWMILGAVVLVLGGTIAYIAYLLRESKQENVELVKNFELDKQELEEEYTSFAKQYDELQFAVKNDSMSQKLTEERVKVQRLLEELKTVQSRDAAEIRRLKEELATLRKVLISYIHQVDSLNTENAGLKAMAKEVTAKYNQATAQISSLAQDKQNLNEKVTLAAQLDATNIALQTKNKRGKDTKKVKDMKQFTVNFSIARNVTAQTGQKTVYVRIVKPDNNIVGNSGSFNYENRTIPFSIKRAIEYTGEEQPVTLYWDVDEFLHAGTYRVEIFADGNLIGSRSFNLGN